MTLTSFIEYGGFIVALYLVSLGILQKVVKPFILHPLRKGMRTPQQTDPVTGEVTIGEWKRGWYEQAYTFLVQAGLFVSGMFAAGSYLNELDVLGRWRDAAPMFAIWTGLEYTPWMGATISVLLMTFLGEFLHDYFTEHELTIPILKKKR